MFALKHLGQHHSFMAVSEHFRLLLALGDHLRLDQGRLRGLLGQRWHLVYWRRGSTLNAGRLVGCTVL